MKKEKKRHIWDKPSIIYICYVNVWHVLKHILTCNCDNISSELPFHRSAIILAVLLHNYLLIEHRLTQGKSHIQHNNIHVCNTERLRPSKTSLSLCYHVSVITATKLADYSVLYQRQWKRQYNFNADLHILLFSAANTTFSFKKKFLHKYILSNHTFLAKRFWLNVDSH